MTETAELKTSEKITDKECEKLSAGRENTETKSPATPSKLFNNDNQ